MVKVTDTAAFRHPSITHPRPTPENRLQHGILCLDNVFTDSPPTVAASQRCGIPWQGGGAASTWLDRLKLAHAYSAALPNACALHGIVAGLGDLEHSPAAGRLRGANVGDLACWHHVLLVAPDCAMLTARRGNGGGGPAMRTRSSTSVLRPWRQPLKCISLV